MMWLGCVSGSITADRHLKVILQLSGVITEMNFSTTANAETEPPTERGHDVYTQCVVSFSKDPAEQCSFMYRSNPVGMN